MLQLIPFKLISHWLRQQNTIIYYDQWENGFDADIANPINIYSVGIPGCTQIWGDGNSANGFPPGIPRDIIYSGTVIVLNNPINTNDIIHSHLMLQNSRAEFIYI